MIHPIIPDTKILVSQLPGGGYVASRADAGTKVTNVASQAMPPEDGSAGSEHAYWGSSDTQPTQMRQKFQAVPIAMATLEKKVKFLHGNGLAYYREADLANGVNVERAYIPEIEAWLQRNYIRTRWLLANITDYAMHINTFTEFIREKGNVKINAIYHKSAEFCRVSPQNPKRNWRVEKLFYAPRFAEGTGVNKDNRVEMPLFQWDDEVKWLKDNANAPKFGMHSYYPMPGTIYYANPFWIGLTEKNSWLDVAANVPRIVSAMQHNQVIIKYMITIPMSYFQARYPDWDTWGHKERNTLIDQKITALNEALVGTDNALKTLTTIVNEDPVSGAHVGAIKIEALDDKAKRDVWVPDSDAADQQIVRALGVHASQMALQPAGGKMGAGSGSDQRESYNSQISLNTIDQEIILEPLQLVSRINGWGVRFFIDHTWHTTTNDQETGLVPSDTTIEAS